MASYDLLDNDQNFIMIYKVFHEHSPSKYLFMIYLPASNLKDFVQFIKCSLLLQLLRYYTDRQLCQEHSFTFHWVKFLFIHSFIHSKFNSNFFINVFLNPFYHVDHYDICPFSSLNIIFILCVMVSVAEIFIAPPLGYKLHSSKVRSLFPFPRIMAQA